MNRFIPLNKALDILSLTEMVGQLFMPAAFINDTEEEIQKMEHLIQKYGVGGLCFFHSRASAATNFEGKKKIVYNESSLQVIQALVLRYQKASKYPLLIAIDAEWGLAMRIENTPQYPYAITLGAIVDNNELIFEVGKNIASDCKAVGIHWNLSPCVDINNNPTNPVIGYRSFGENKYMVTEKALAYIKGTQSEGVLTCIKHFPGHGDTATDSHLQLPLIKKSKKELLENELYPFQELISQGVDSVMVGHLSVPALANGKLISSSVSKEIIKGLLRQEMGFNGVVISDALNMHAVSKEYTAKGMLEWLAFDAGNDMLCFAENIAEGITAIVKNASEDDIKQSFGRIWCLKEKMFIGKQPAKMAIGENSAHLNTRLAQESITLLKGNTEDLAAFRETDFCTLTYKRSADEAEAEISARVKEMREIIANEEHILLLLTPPQVKPVNNFGFLPPEITFLNAMIATKKVVLYLFGNPFVLNYLNLKNLGIAVLVYQNSKEFQDVATDHFLGKIVAKGNLPVTICR